MAGRDIFTKQAKTSTNKGIAMTIGAALVVIVAGLLIAVLLNATIGTIVAVIGLVGLILAALSSRGTRSAL